MKALIGALIVVLAVAGLGVWLLKSEPSPQRQGSQPELPSGMPEAAHSETATQANAEKIAGSELARQRLADAKRALQSIVTERKNVEAKLEQAERDVEELERFIEGIEARGEDPADYADEGLELFQPAFYAYQDAFDELELVETMEEAAEEEVAAAEQQLARTLAESGEE